ncbi:MAG: HEAT repeat domain-containing protein, partial [Candidatus Brocadiae bacterium]|nr:HEAT repeat domain-containing protein [Candidatus Brocadiia bacterium]
EKVKAIGMLRGLEDEKVLTFLKDVVLRCPERLREQAIRGLLEGGARRYHLPIYLEALTSDHFRTVQGGATAVQQLRATEAAPLLLKALEHPVADTEYRLRKALAMLATENELDGLSRLVDGLDPDAALGMKIDLLRALLNTGSDGAIPPIVRLLQADEQLIRSVGYGDDILESAAVFGPDLLGKLIEAAGEEFAPTLQRVWAEVERKTADLPEGAAYVPVDLDLAFQEREIDYKLMFPAERQQSFETVMARVKEDDESHRRELEQVLAELAAMGPEERESSRAVDQLARLRQEYYRSEWLAELGMTRDERAIAVLMEHLEHANCHVRAEAVKGLMSLYDEEIGDRLAARLLDEEPLVQSVIVFVIGNAADARHVDALVALAHEPTLVRTKLGWVRTMEALSPERAKPVLEYWVTSPDKTLAGAAREALGRLGQAARREQ